MSKKPRGKSGSMSGPAKWEQGLLAAPLEEEGWKLATTLIVGKRYEDSAHIDALIHGLKSGARKRFSFIQKDALYQEVLEIVNPKNKKTKESPQHAEICETVKPFIDGGEELSLPLMARLIKFKLLYIKQIDQARILNEKKLAADKAKGAEVKGKGAKEKPKSAGKKGKGKAPEQQPSAKQGSKLKKRGEEDEKSFIDDEPDDGPEHYVVIAGFQNPHLVIHLAEINIHIDSVIKVSSEDYTKYEMKNQGNLPDTGTVKDDKTLAAEELARAKVAQCRKELKQFWQDILLLLQQAPEGSRLHDVVRHETAITEDLIPSNLDDDKDGSKKLQYGMAVFEKVACIMYDTVDLKRQHKTFLQNMKLLRVPTGADRADAATAAAVPQPAVPTGRAVAAASEVAAASAMDVSSLLIAGAAGVDMRYYNDLMNTVPQESVSVPLMLYCMVEQVDATERSKEPPSEWVPPLRGDGLEHNLASYVGSLVGKLSLNAEEEAKLESLFNIRKSPQQSKEQPVLIHPADSISLRNGHLDAVYGFKARDVEVQMLKHLPFYCLTESLKDVSSKKTPDRSARLQELLHFCVDSDVALPDVDHAVKQFVFECMKLAASDKDGYIGDHVLRYLNQVSTQCVPWDYPYPFYKGMLPPEQSMDQQRLVLDRNIAAGATAPHVADEDEQDLEDVFGRSLSPASESSRVSSALSNHQKAGITRTPTPPVKSQKIEAGRRSRSTTPGILRKDGSQRGSRSSVHFDGDSNMGQSVDQDSSQKSQDAMGEAKAGETMSMEQLVPACHQRNLNSWCYGELLEPEVLMQVIQEASYTLPFMDAYHCKRDDSLFIVLHNPCDGSLLKHCSEWHDELHSNVGLRNYLEHVAALVADWATAEEAKYQGVLQRGDVDRMLDDEQQAAQAAARSAKRARSKSPRSRKGSAQSKSPGPEEKVNSYITDGFVKSGSLKAAREEQQRLQAERDEEERLRLEKAAEKRAKSAKSKATPKKEDDKKPVSRSSSKSRPSKHEDVGAEAPAAPKGPEKQWPFVGYDLGNKFVHARGSASTLFPCDGSIVRTEVVEFVQGSTFVRTSLIKDGHVFTVHVKDPQTPSPASEEGSTFQEKADTEGTEKLSTSKESVSTTGKATENIGKDPIEAFGSFTAAFADGMSLSFSIHGATGVPKAYKKYEPAPYVMAVPRSPSPAAGLAPDKKEASPSKKVKDKGIKDKGGNAATPEPLQQQEEEPPKDVTQVAAAESSGTESQFNELYLTCPDGLSVQYMPESRLGIAPPAEGSATGSGRTGQLAVRQAYPFKTLGRHRCEEDRRHPAMEEVARVIRSDGTVIKTMQDGTTQILYATGMVTVVSGLAGAGSGNSAASSTPTATAAATVAAGTSARAESPYRTGSAKSKAAADRDPSPGKSKGVIQSRKDTKQVLTSDEPPAPVEDQQEQKKMQFITTLPSGERHGSRGEGQSFHVPRLYATLATDPDSMQVLLTREDHVMIVTMPNGTKVSEHADGTRIMKFTKEFSSGNGEGGRTVQSFVRIECPGYASVEYNVNTGQCLTYFGSESVLSVLPDGTYCLYYRRAFILQVLKDGNTLYIPDPHSHLISRAMEGDTASFQKYISQCDDRAYVMNHASEVICKVTDLNENTFVVHHDGSYDIQPKESRVSSEDAPPIAAGIPELWADHSPRFFILRNDGTGLELLRYQEVVKAVLDEQPGVAVVREPVLNYPGVNSITVMKPYTKNVSQQWLTGYSVDNLIPPGLRSRDLTSLPAQEIKKDGPKFGTTLGRGLAVGGAPVPQPLPEPVRCPETLLLRRFVQHEPLTDDVRQRLYSGLKAFADFSCQRDEARKELLPKDPRSFDEQQVAADAVAVAASQGLIADARSVYEKTLAPRLPSPPPKAKPKRSEADWARDRRELADEAMARSALHGQDVPPYFSSELGKSYLTAKAQALFAPLPDTQAQRERQLPTDPADDVQVLKSKPRGVTEEREHLASDPRQNQALVKTKGESINEQEVQAPRVNHSLGADTGHNRKNRANVNPNQRPGNPTPAHAAVPGSHGHQQQQGGVVQEAVTSSLSQPTTESTPSTSQEEVAELGFVENNIVTSKSLLYDVTMNPRKDAVHVPAYLTTSGKPNAYPNALFEQVEEEHRRHVKTSSVAPKADGTAAANKKTKQARGFELMPDCVNFGVVKEGCTYGCIVTLRNVGIDTCRYKLCQPPPATGLRVIYTPGPVAAGMKADLHLELYAIAAGVEGGVGTGKISHDLEVVTETDVMYLPISAMVLTREEYDRQSQSPQGMAKEQRSAGVRYITDRPPNELGIIRPRKDIKLADNGSNAILSIAS